MGGLNEKMGIELIEISADRVVGTMPVEGNTQPYGLLHGGASVVLAETLGSVGLRGRTRYPDKLSVGVEINATHHRSATSGVVTGMATAIHLGRTMATYEVVITDERGKRVCTSRITCALLPARALRAAEAWSASRAGAVAPHRATRREDLGELTTGAGAGGSPLRAEPAAHGVGGGHPEHGVRAERDAGP